MKLTDENQDGMDCRPPTGRDTGISVPPRLQRALDEAVAPGGGQKAPAATGGAAGHHRRVTGHTASLWRRADDRAAPAGALPPEAMRMIAAC